ncbi:hypothetical protein [Flagellimonas lutimaris]|uniref:hypothetical protein n=1 Tax=Flagellimonas lutimaris TaxID=475082 RepID=UPI003F5CE2C4
MNYKTKTSSTILGFASVAIAIILFNGCKLATKDKDATVTGDPKENLVEAKESLDKARKDYVLKYEAFKLESDNKIAENEKIIAELKAKAKMDGDAAKQEFEKELAALEQKNQSLKEKMSYYKDEGSKEWESFKIEFDRDMDNLGKALKDLTKNNTD